MRRLAISELCCQCGPGAIPLSLQAKNCRLTLFQPGGYGADFLFKLINLRRRGVGCQASCLFKTGNQADHLQFLLTHARASGEQLVLCFAERQLRVEQGAIGRLQLCRKTVCERLRISNLPGIVERFAETRCSSLQIQRFQGIFGDPETALIEITKLLPGLTEALIRGFFIPACGLGIVDRHVVHAVGMDTCNIVLRFCVALPGRHQPALQRQRSAGEITERVFAAARTAYDGGRADQSPGREVGTGTAELSKLPRQLAINDDCILHVGRDNACSFRRFVADLCTRTRHNQSKTQQDHSASDQERGFFGGDFQWCGLLLRLLFLLAAQVTVIETAVLILSFSLTLRAQSDSGVFED